MDKVLVFLKRAIPVHGTVREFSKEIHGEDYQNLAKQFMNANETNIDHAEGLEEQPESAIVGTRTEFNDGVKMPADEETAEPTAEADETTETPEPAEDAPVEAEPQTEAIEPTETADPVDPVEPAEPTPEETNENVGEEPANADDSQQ